jgi:ribonuclease P protein component
LAGFPRRARLLRPADFQRVFDAGRRKRQSAFTAVECANEVGHARLGLAIAKKAMPRAVDRNRFKRCIRESFRCANALPPCDVVILAAPMARSTSPAQLQQQLRDYWSRLPERWPRG